MHDWLEDIHFTKDEAVTFCDMGSKSPFFLGGGGVDLIKCHSYTTGVIRPTINSKKHDKDKIGGNSL